MIRLINFLIDSLFIKKCFLCGKQKNTYLCKTCLKSLRFKEQTCLKCGKNSLNGEFCLKCQTNFTYQGVLVAGDLKNINLKKAINFFKYNFIKEVGYHLGLFLFQFFKEQNESNPIIFKKTTKKFNSKNSIIIPVPLSKKRQRWRGFNQSLILSQVVSTKEKIEIFDGLIKKRNSRNQAQLSLNERRGNLKDCFSFKNEDEALKALRGKKIIIIDDVTTTGSTLEEISQVVKKKNPKEIWGLVLAHG